MSRARMGILGTVSVVAMAIGVGPAQAALECGDTITSDKTLRSDLECPLDTNGLLIDGSGVTLDMNGHTISAAPQADTSALQVEGSENVKVVDGKLRGFNVGLNVSASTDVTAKGLDIRKAQGTGGVRDAGQPRPGPERHRARARRDRSVHLNSTDHIKIAGNDFRNLGMEIQGDNQKIVGNEISAPNEPGVDVIEGAGTELERNQISEVTGGAAIVLLADVGEVRVEENSRRGSRVRRHPHLLRVQGPATIVRNEVRDVNFNGFFVAGNTEVTLRDNLARGSNNGDGIHVEDDDTLIEDNRVVNNDQHGIESTSANGSGNVAKRNGITPQCMPESLCE